MKLVPGDIVSDTAFASGDYRLIRRIMDVSQESALPPGPGWLAESLAEGGEVVLADHHIHKAVLAVVARNHMSTTKWHGDQTFATREYRDGHGIVGHMVIDRGRVNWRPNQLRAGFVSPQVVFHEHGKPASELIAMADDWVRSNTSARVAGLNKSETFKTPERG